MKKIFNYLFIFVCLFIFTNSVNAECTYNLVEESTIFTLSSGTTTGNSNNYYTSSATYFKGFETKFTIDSTNNIECHGIFPGQYLIDFYVYSESDINKALVLSNFSSNFKNIDLTSGNLVANEIKSQLVDFYSTTYNGKKAYRLLYKFTFSGDYTNEFDFIINTNTNYFFTKSTGIGGYGISYSNIYDYNTTIIDSFTNAKNNNEINDNLGNIEDSINDNFNTCYSNLLNTSISSQTINGVSFTYNADGSIYASGTATGNITLAIGTFTFESGKTYTISGSKGGSCGQWCSQSGSNTYRITSTNGQYYSYNGANTYNIGSTITQTIYIQIAVGTTIETTFYPMITEGSSSHDYVKYGTEICTNKVDDTNNKLDEQLQQDKEQHEEAQETRKGMWATLKSMLNFLNPLSEDFFAYKLVELMLNMLKSLFIPEDMDFVTNFVEALESKLGFIAAIPVKIIEFTMSLATATWSEFKSIQLPSISIFGYNFWNAQEIDLTEAINIFKPFKYVTDCICVVICAQTLNKWREKFTGGGSGK